MGGVIENRKEVILLCESFSTANYHVMIDVIRAIDNNAFIHVVADTNEDLCNIKILDNVCYYQVHNWQYSFKSKIQKLKPRVLGLLLDSVFSRIMGHLNNLFVPSYEKKMLEIAQGIIDERKIKNVFSVCFRFYAHRVALELSRKNDIQWLQFWLDPYSNRFDSHDRLWRIEAEAVEKSFFEACDIIYALPEVFIGNRPIKRYLHKLKTFQIPYLQDRVVRVSNKNIIFAGGFLKKIREPEPVLNLILSILPNIDREISFSFYVREKDKYHEFEERSEGRIKFFNYVSRDELHKLFSECFMLLTIGNYGIKQMPSKTIEYVSFRKPILYFYKGEGDSSYEYLKEYPDVCRIDLERNESDNKNLLMNYLSNEHAVISYDDLMKISAFYSSTPQCLGNLIKLK